MFINQSDNSTQCIYFLYTKKNNPTVKLVNFYLSYLKIFNYLCTSPPCNIEDRTFCVTRELRIVTTLSR